MPIYILCKINTLGMKLLVPIGFLQVQQTKHFSCHCLVLYSIFFMPENLEKLSKFEHFETPVCCHTLLKHCSAQYAMHTCSNTSPHPSHLVANWASQQGPQQILSALLPNCLSTRLVLHLLQRKQASCQCFSLYERSFESIPMIFPHSSQLLANTFS